MLTGGALAISGYAHADSNADGGAARSPGLLAGNTVQLPVNVPVNVCGNTVNAVGLLNPAAGNSCANSGQGGSGSQTGSSGATAESGGKDSPGFLSGNSVQLPIDIPVNVTGNSVNVVGIGNAAVGNSSSNTPGKPPVRPRPATPPKAATPHTPAPQPPGPEVALARTGAGPVAYAVPAGAAMLLGGIVLYRRFRPAQESGRRA
ncbi:chaplin [Streptomyces sp. NPDC019443]|uniref:chaplin n=1 Tax=Streptomyces sp. NPDC019443 TaxID=3365061 RepID=UPI0037B72CA7